MNKLQRITLAAAFVLAIVCGVSLWAGDDWQRAVRFDLLTRGYPFVQLVDATQHPERIRTNTMTTALVVHNGTDIGWVDMGGAVHLYDQPAAGGSIPPQFYLLGWRTISGMLAAVLAILSLPRIVLWGRKPTAGFPIKVRPATPADRM